MMTAPQKTLSNQPKRKKTMKRDQAARFAATLSAALLGAAGFLHSGAPAAAQTDAEITSLVQSYRDAFNQCDAALFASLLHPQFSSYGVSGELSRGRDAAAESMRTQCDTDLRFEMSLDVLDTADSGPLAFAAAVAMGSVTPAGGQTMNNPLRVTFVFEREGADGPLSIRHTHLSIFR